MGVPSHWEVRPVSTNNGRRWNVGGPNAFKSLLFLICVAGIGYRLIVSPILIRPQVANPFGAFAARDLDSPTP